MEKRKLEIGDVVQLNPEGIYSDRYPGYLLVITEPKEWGCQGYILAPNHFESVRYKNLAYIRAKFEDIEYVGKLPWILQEKREDEFLYMIKKIMKYS
jgi:hypothetical protein